jgi:hypothetical protein
LKAEADQRALRLVTQMAAIPSVDGSRWLLHVFQRSCLL